MTILSTLNLQVSSVKIVESANKMFINRRGLNEHERGDKPSSSVLRK